MRFVVLDFETFFSKDFTLGKMSTEAYVRDPRFVAHGAAIKWSADTPAVWYDEPQLRQELAEEDWSDVCIIAHHAQFDGLILTHHFDVHPQLWACTLSMARLVLGNHHSVSLDSVRKHYGFAPKVTPYNLFRDKHWHEMDDFTRQKVAAGACDEAESIWQIFGLLAKEFPTEEYAVVDQTIRMFVEPCLQADVNLLNEVWMKEETGKATRMALLNVSESDLQSSEKFAALLRTEGEEPAVKAGKKGDIYAFAKTDEYMRDLLEHDNDRVRLLAEARLGAKSTLMQTRAETLGFAASRGPMPVYLRYCGAHTTRWSGGDGCLTADTQVIVYDWQKGLTEKRIVDILPDDLIWDGEDFVKHDGVAFSGYQETIEHDGIRGTKDHLVYDISGKTISLAEAARTGTRLMGCRKPSSREVAVVKARK